MSIYEAEAERRLERIIEGNKLLTAVRDADPCSDRQEQMQKAIRMFADLMPDRDRVFAFLTSAIADRTWYTSLSSSRSERAYTYCVDTRTITYEGKSYGPGLTGAMFITHVVWATAMHAMRTAAPENQLASIQQVDSWLAGRKSGVVELDRDFPQAAEQRLHALVLHMMYPLAPALFEQLRTHALALTICSSEGVEAVAISTRERYRALNDLRLMLDSMCDGYIAEISDMITR